MLRLMVGSMAPGSQINMRVLHNGETRNITITLGEVPVKETASAETPSRQKSSAPDSGRPRLGIAVADLTPELAQHLKIPKDVRGVIIGDVEEGSAAAEAGLQLGDIVQQVNHKPIRTVAEFHSELTTHQSTPVLLLVNREGHTLFVAVEPR